MKPFKFINIQLAILVVIAALWLDGCSTPNQESKLPNVISATNHQVPGNIPLHKEVIGGWAPVFLTKMNYEVLDNIASGINQNRIRKATITYPTKMQSLAIKICNYLQQKTKQPIAMQSIELRDTDQVKYKLTQVIITLYFS